MNSYDLKYQLLRELDVLIELSAQKGFIIGSGQKDNGHSTSGLLNQKRIILKLLGINI
ncbi:hypothetical protein [Escherichia phage vB_EcoM_SCS4]|nr:hypothetical protein [Escherichia phage vB_EcoM_SCS4]